MISVVDFHQYDLNAVFFMSITLAVIFCGMILVVVFHQCNLSGGLSLV